MRNIQQDYPIILNMEERVSVCSFHVTYAIQSESILYSCLNVKELLARNRCEIWSLSDCNWIRTHNQLVRKRTLNYLAKLASLAKWLSVRLQTNWFWVRIQLQEIVCYLILVSDLRSEAKGSRSSPAATYVQRWALCSNYPANV